MKHAATPIPGKSLAFGAVRRATETPVKSNQMSIFPSLEGTRQEKQDAAT